MSTMGSVTLRGVDAVFEMRCGCVTANTGCNEGYANVATGV